MDADFPCGDGKREFMKGKIVRGFRKKTKESERPLKGNEKT